MDEYEGDTSRRLGASTAPTPSSSEVTADPPFRRWLRWAIGIDLVAAGLAVVAASWLRFGSTIDDQPVGIPYSLLGAFIAAGWVLFLALSGGYEMRTQLFAVEELRRVLRAAIVLLASLGFAHFVFRLNLSRGYVGALVPLLTVFTAAGRLLLRSINDRWIASGVGRHRAIAIGPAQEVARLVESTNARSSSIVRFVGFVADDLGIDDPTPRPLNSVERVGTRRDVAEHVRAGLGTDLLVRVGQPREDELWSLGRLAYELGVPVSVAPDQSDALTHVAVSYVPMGTMPLLMVETPSMRPVSRFVKRVFDLVLGSLFLVVLSPVMLVVGLSIYVADGLPVFFKQRRVGFHGQPFSLLKFRTMRVGAEHEVESLAGANEADGPLFKVKEDPRVTGLGRFLRRYSLDETPQIFHVLSGKMSLVGPRPPLPTEAETYDERSARRMLVKPGLTGLWQVGGRSDLPWDEAIYLDLMYIDHWSPLLDLLVIARTVRVVIRPTGAY